MAANPKPREEFLFVFIVVSDAYGQAREHGCFKNRAIAEARARLMGHHFGVIEASVPWGHPDQTSIFASYEFDAMADEHRWSGLHATEAAALKASGPRGFVRERKIV